MSGAVALAGAGLVGRWSAGDVPASVPPVAPPAAVTAPTGAAPQASNVGAQEPRAVLARRRRASLPRSIRIPTIGVDASLVPLGLTVDHQLEVPQSWENAGWYTGGPRPGEHGPAVIAGHVDSTSGPAVFYRLGELRRDDPIYVRRADGSTLLYRVDGVARWPKDRFPTHRVYRAVGPAALRLITCGGSFDAQTGHYRDNTIVFATRRSET